MNVKNMIIMTLLLLTFTMHKKLYLYGGKCSFDSKKQKVSEEYAKLESEAKEEIEIDILDEYDAFSLNNVIYLRYVVVDHDDDQNLNNPDNSHLCEITDTLFDIPRSQEDLLKVSKNKFEGKAEINQLNKGTSKNADIEEQKRLKAKEIQNNNLGQEMIKI